MAERHLESKGTEPAKIPVYLITGFLGSGKTTLVKEVIETFSDHLKIAVIQNEFAPANIDGRELKRITHKHFELLEINNGSVFCVCLLSDFITSLSDFAGKYNPQIILLEASGLSDPVSVSEIFSSPALVDKLYLAGTVCVVDAKNYEKLTKVQQRIKHQVMIADSILINKSDLNNDPAIPDMLNKLNPFATKYFTTYCKAPFNELFLPFNTKLKSQKTPILFVSQNGDRPNIQSAVLRTTKSLKKDNLHPFLENASSKSYRLKGYVLLENGKSVSVQCVYTDYKTEEIENPIRQTELISLGTEMNARSLKDLYLQYT